MEVGLYGVKEGKGFKNLEEKHCSLIGLCFKAQGSGEGRAVVGKSRKWHLCRGKGGKRRIMRGGREGRGIRQHAWGGSRLPPKKHEQEFCRIKRSKKLHVGGQTFKMCWPKENKDFGPRRSRSDVRQCERRGTYRAEGQTRGVPSLESGESGTGAFDSVKRELGERSKKDIGGTDGNGVGKNAASVARGKKDSSMGWNLSIELAFSSRGKRRSASSERPVTKRDRQSPSDGNRPENKSWKKKEKVTKVEGTGTWAASAQRFFRGRPLHRKEGLRKL